jgi:predicted transcriptional regulator YdeE
MKRKFIESFQIIGISVRTSNNDGQAAQDIGGLWNKFMTEGITDKIPNKEGNDIYSVYTHYDGDYTQPYTTILGCKVSNIDKVPDGMVVETIGGSDYVQFVAKGDLTEGAVYKEWLNIWKTNLDRAYTADFEVYGEKAQNPKDAEIDVFVAVN